MKERILEKLRCPACKGELGLNRGSGEADDIKDGELYCRGCEAVFPVINYIPRFVNDDTYAKGFGFQWNRHSRTLVDKFNGTTITHDRFYGGTKWKREELAGKSVLEAGCGSGRFTEVMLDAGMEVYALDYSNAVDACMRNLGPHPALHLFQGNIYTLPFELGGFDFVFCFGVLQHTPDVKRSVECLIDQLGKGGRLAVDVYPRTVRALLHYPRYAFRPLTKRLPPNILYRVVEVGVDVLLPLSILVKRIPIVGRYLFPLFPVANYWGTYTLNRSMLREWSVIDTFDWLACWYDQPQRATTLESWLCSAGLSDVEIHELGSYVGLGRNDK